MHDMRLIYIFFYNDTATTEIYTLSLHDALPISSPSHCSCCQRAPRPPKASTPRCSPRSRSEEHTSELQSQSNLVCRLLLEKKNKTPPLVIPTHTVCSSYRIRSYSVLAVPTDFEF